MAFDSQTRNKLQRMVGACRRLLADEFDDQLQGLYGIYAQDGRVLELEKLTSLDDDHYQTATLLRDRINHLKSGMASEKQPLAEAVRRVLREQAFTLLNRFAALRMAEERGFVQECVGQGLKSKGFQVFETVARSGLGGAYERYVTFIHGMFDELSLDLGVLFDRWSPFGLLFPREPALLKFFDLLNDAELKPLWREDETIGWIYQYFNDEAERKKMREESSAPRNSRELAIRNQFFTPRYVVQFLTDNTLGRIWYEMTQGQTRLKEECLYLVRRPDEVFLAASSDPAIESALEWLQKGTVPVPDIWSLHSLVNGYIRAGSAGEKSNEWVEERLPRIRPESIQKFSTQEILDLLFLFCRKERFCEGTLEALQTEIDLLLREIEGRVLSAQQENLSQEDLLKQPVYIPHRPLKDPRTILMLDPACGSMHFGLYAFDLFEVIYEEAWELEKRGAEFQPRPPGMLSLRETHGTKEDFLKDVSRLIIEHNLHGIDIDPRCAQIAGLSLWLRAQKAWQRLGLKPAERPAIKRSNIVCAEPMPGEKELLREFVEREFRAEERGVCLRLLEAIFDKMQLAGEAGSLLKIEEEIRTTIEDARRQWQTARQRPEFFDFAELDTRFGAQQELPAADLRSLTSEDFWQRIEERIYAALRDYAEQAENGGGFQRRLFAEDAARGFAFIDVCRKRYDMALMNPPFGEPSNESRNYIGSAYPRTKNDIYAAFVERWLGRLQSKGRLGAITSRTGFFLSSFQSWREDIVLREAQPVLLSDLGYGVLDSAMVETASYVLEVSTVNNPLLCIRALADLNKGDALADAVRALYTGEDNQRVFVVVPSEFRQMPGTPFVYWVSTHVRAVFRRLPAFESEGRIVKQGLVTADDFRFLRAWWEVEAAKLLHQEDGQRPEGVKDATWQSGWLKALERKARWVPFLKGGSSRGFYRDVELVVGYSPSDQEGLKSIGRFGRGAELYFHEGITWPARPHHRGAFSNVPRGVIFSHTGTMAFSAPHQHWPLLAILNSDAYVALLHLLMPRGGDASGQTLKYEIGYVRAVPIPKLSAEVAEMLNSASRRSWTANRALDAYEITSHAFVLTPVLGCAGSTLAARIGAWRALTDDTDRELRCNQSKINATALRLYDLVEDNLTTSNAQTGETESQSNTCSTQDAQTDGDLTIPIDASALVESLMDWILGCVLGRWDIRYATGDKTAPELPDPFAPLPVCPPGQLQNAQGLPAGPEDVPAAYPLHIPWDGILVDDRDHPLDIERRVREVIEIIWKDRAEAIEHEACEILGVKSLRDYFRKPAGFFADHLKRYSKSRRQAPIYWPLSTASGSYTLWIYYHRLTDQTLFQCVNDFVKPKLEEVNRDIERLRGELQRADGGSSKQREKLEELEDFAIELKEFHDELLRVAGLPYKPNLNDGVLITASPHWKLFRFPKWQKDLKACWAALEGEEYEWAHLAYTIWPDRVKKVCKTDRSIAIAHGLEELCAIKAPEKKAKRGKKKADAELDLEGDSK